MVRFSKEMLESLLPYASPAQEKVALLRIEGKTYKEIEAITGINSNNAATYLARLEVKAARRGWSPNHDLSRPVAPGQHLRGASTLYDEDGKVRLQWVKSQIDREREAQILIDTIEDASKCHKRFRPTTPPKHFDEDLLTLITITDFHMGMYAWEAESGEDWDVSIAKRVFLDAVHRLVQGSPKSGTAIFCQLGDFLHFDGLLAVTPANKHVLDADTRYGKLVDLTLYIMVEAIHLLLKRFPKVRVIQAEGNHDEVGSIWLRKHIKHVFSEDDRVEVDDSEFPYYACLHGETMLAFHHGHKQKLNQLHKFFASEPRFREMWGQAKHTYIHAGHLHHEKVVEDGGAIAEQHPTLAARDAYAARGGWQSQRGAKAITYHKTHGEVLRMTVRPDGTS